MVSNLTTKHNNNVDDALGVQVQLWMKKGREGNKNTTEPKVKALSGISYKHSCHTNTQCK